MVAIPAPEIVAFCDRLQRLITRLGPKAFGLSDTAILYSGPNQKLGLAVAGVANNIERSGKQAKDLGAARIDGTLIGRILTRAKLYEHFNEIYNDNITRTDTAIFEVWAYASRQFVKSGFRHVATAVCGADPKRVFRAHELKVLLTEETSVEDINGVALQHFKDIYAAHGGGDKGFYAAYVEICQTELTMIRRAAEVAPEGKREATWEDYNARKQFFDLEQSATAEENAKAALTAVSAHHDAIVATDTPVRPNQADMINRKKQKNTPA